jgi:hypothetical protein
MKKRLIDKVLRELQAMSKEEIDARINHILERRYGTIENMERVLTNMQIPEGYMSITESCKLLNSTETEE